MPTQTTATISFSTPHQPSTLIPLSISITTPETEPLLLGFGFLTIAAAAAGSGGLLHGPPPPFFVFVFFSNIYIHINMYLQYFNKKKLRVPKVAWVLLDTAQITVRYRCSVGKSDPQYTGQPYPPFLFSFILLTFFLFFLLIFFLYEIYLPSFFKCKEQIVGGQPTTLLFGSKKPSH